jgi:hypothetical protein
MWQPPHTRKAVAQLRASSNLCIKARCFYLFKDFVPIQLKNRRAFFLLKKYKRAAVVTAAANYEL